MPIAPAVEPGGPNGVSVIVAASMGVPSPQSIVAACVSSVPGSANGSVSVKRVPSSVVRSAPVTVGGAFATVTRFSAAVEPPLSLTTSVTV